MRLGRVIGSVWATRKHPTVTAKRMLLVQPLRASGAEAGAPEAMLDTVDAGVGDTVLYVTSAEAALPFKPQQELTAADATIVGVVDRVDVG